MKLAINTDAISQDFETAVLLGLEWGVEYFELKRVYGKRVPDITNEEVSLIQNVLRANGVALSSLAPGLFKIPLNQDMILQEAGRRFDMTVALADCLNTRSIVIFGFIRDDRHTEAEALRQIIDVFGRVAARAEQEGLMLFLENDRGLWGESPESVRQILAGVNSRAFKLNWDPGNLIGAFPEAPYPTGYELIREYVGHVHVKDAKATGDAQFAHTMMGSGDVDWVGQFERLLRDGYSGFCVVEPHFGNRVSSSRNHILETKKALMLARSRVEATARESVSESVETGGLAVIDSASFLPPARREISDAGLQRPDWTVVGHRDPRLLWLDKNENTDPLLQTITFKVLAEMDPRSVAIYPDAAPLYHKLAEYIGVSPQSLVLAPGSDGIIGSVFRAFIEPGNVVLLTHPTYAMYQVYCSMHGADTARLEYLASEMGPTLRPETVTGAIRKRRPKLICLPNPDSPTGTVFEPDALRDIIRSALEVGSMILVDEAYYPFYADTVVPWIAEFPNLIVARTFSKAWGLTGVRLGYGIATPAVAALLQKVRPNYEVNTVAVAMALRLIKDFNHEMMASVKRLNEGRDRFVSAMKALGLRTLASHGNFCHVAFGSWADSVHATLRDIVLYRQDFDVPCLKGFSRFSSTSTRLFTPVIKRIRDVVRQSG